MTDIVDAVTIALHRRTPLPEPTARRIARFASFCAVGGSGVVVDLGVTVPALSVVTVLAANAAGFVVAVTWNFALHRVVTFSDTAASRVTAVLRRYAVYVAVHLATFLLFRATTIAALTSLGIEPLPATAAGVGVAAVGYFLSSERIFDAAAA